MDTGPRLDPRTSMIDHRNELQLNPQCSGLDTTDVNWMRNSLDVALFIVSNGTSCLSDIPNEWQHSTAAVVQCFDSVAASPSNSIEFLYRLIQTYAHLYGIQLHLIVYLEKRYMIIDENYFVNQNRIQIHRQNHAVICCSADNTCYLPFHIEDSNQRKHTIFTANELVKSSQIQHIIDEANRIMIAAHSNQVDQNANSMLDQPCHMAVDENSPQAAPQEISLTSPLAIKKLLENVSQIADILEPHLQVVAVSWVGFNLNFPTLRQSSAQELCDTTREQLYRISEILQKNCEPVTCHETATNQAMNASISQPGPSSNPSSENHAQTTTAMIPVISNSTSVPAIINEPIVNLIRYEAPTLINGPKKTWNARYFRDLVPKKREKSAAAGIALSPSVETHGKATIGLLQGIGAERSPIQVQVPIAQHDEMYLACGTRTIQSERHALKIVVPAKTTVNKADCTHENNLNCLNFTECSPLHEFDRATNSVCMKITSEEHTAQLKDVPLYMLNLYQNQQLTKEMIQDGNLRQCVLAFWLCVKVGGGYVAISRESHSGIITEVKKKPSGRKATPGEKTSLPVMVRQTR